MTRTATNAALTESQSEAPRPFAFVELDFPSGFLRVNSSDRTIAFDSGSGVEDFLGVGNLGSITVITEGTDLVARGVELSLSGIPAANIALAFENAQRRSGKVWTGYFDSDYVLVADPILFFSGLIDNTSVTLGETATVTVFLESRLITWQRPKIQRYTNENQLLRFPGDKFLEFVNQMVEKELLWGIAGDGAPIVQTVSIATPIGTGGRGNESGILVRPEVAPAFEGRGVEGGTRVIKEGGAR